MPVPRTNRRQPTLSSPAQINAVLRYAPERQALAQAVQEARSEHESAIAGAQSEARLNANAVANAVPTEQGIYDRAQASSSAARQQLASVLSGLGGGVQPFQAAAASEGAQGAEKTARERAGAETDLHSQALATAAAPAFARTLADQHLGSALSKILASTQSVAGQEGLATSSEVAREAKEQQQQALTERGQNLTHESAQEGHSLTAQGLAQKREETKERVNASNGTNGKPRLLPAATLAKAGATLRDIEHEARELRAEGHGRKAIYEELTSEHPPTSVPKEDKNGAVFLKEKLGGGRLTGKKAQEAIQKGEVELEKAPALKSHDALLAQAALDSVYGYGRVSKATLQKLHNAGYSIKALQLEGPPAPKPAGTYVPPGRGNEPRSSARR